MDRLRPCSVETRVFLNSGLLANSSDRPPTRRPVFEEINGLARLGRSRFKVQEARRRGLRLVLQ